MISIALSRVKDSDDNDIMTDVFATLFGNRNVVSINFISCSNIV